MSRNPNRFHPTVRCWNSTTSSLCRTSPARAWQLGRACPRLQPPTFLPAWKADASRIAPTPECTVNRRCRSSFAARIDQRQSDRAPGPPGQGAGHGQSRTSWRTFWVVGPRNSTRPCGQVCCMQSWARPDKCRTTVLVATGIPDFRYSGWTEPTGTLISGNQPSGPSAGFGTTLSTAGGARSQLERHGGLHG